MLENLNIQDIAKWFEKGCDTNEFGLINNNRNGGDKGFYFLECSDICLLSKLPDVKNKTLLDRAYKRLKKIKDPFARKDFLLTLISEFLRDGRKVIALKLISNEIDNETEMYKLFRSDLLFYRALCYLKVDKSSEALFDLYSALEKTQMQSIDRIHLQILEEIQKQMKNNKLNEGHIVVKDSYQITFMEILKKFEVEVCRFYQQQEVENNETKELIAVSMEQQQQQQQQQIQLDSEENNSNYNNQSKPNQTQNHHGANNAGDWIESESRRSVNNNNCNNNIYCTNNDNPNDSIIINTTYTTTNNYNKYNNKNKANNKSIQLKQKLSTNSYNNNNGYGNYGHNNKNRFIEDNNNYNNNNNNNNNYYYNNNQSIHQKKIYQGKLIKKRQPLPITSLNNNRFYTDGCPEDYHHHHHLQTTENVDNNVAHHYGKFNNRRINQYESSNPMNCSNAAMMMELGHRNGMEVNITYSVDDQKARINVKQIINEPIIDNIFNLKAILVDNLCENYQIATVYEIFEQFGSILNIKQLDGSNKLIIEYDNTEAPRYCISCLSQVELPTVSRPNKYLEFRFYKGEDQKNFRICKQNQIKTSKECYFWRTTGCQNRNCNFYHNRLAKGVDYQEWMRIEMQPSSTSPALIQKPMRNDANSNDGDGSNQQNYGTTTRIITNKSVKRSNSNNNNIGAAINDAIVGINPTAITN